MPVKHIIEVLEKQGEQKPVDKVEPRFKVKYAGSENTRKKLIDKACEWIKYNNENGGCLFDGWEENFKKYIEE